MGDILHGISYSNVYLLISPVLIDVWYSFWSKNTQWIKLFHLSYGSLKSVKLKKKYERTFAEFLVLLWYFLKKFLHSILYISSSNLMFGVCFGIRTLSESNSFIWAMDRSYWSSWKKTSEHSLNFRYFYDIH